MALTMEKKTVETERAVSTAAVQLPLRGESAPTGLRETADILWEDGRLFLEKPRAVEGGVEVRGELYCQALYRLAGDSALRTAVCRIPIRETAEIPDAREGMIARQHGETEQLQAEYAGGRVIFTAAVDLQLQVCALTQTEIVESAEGEGLQCRSRTLFSRKLTAENSAQADLRDEVALPAALRARGVLISRCAVRSVTCERETGGVRVGGEVLVEALVRCGVEERPVAMVKYTLPFEQALAFPDWARGEAEGHARVKELECELDDGDGDEPALRIRCEVVTEAELYLPEEIRCLDDVYGTGSRDYPAQTTLLPACTGTVCAQGREEFRGEMLLQEGAAGVGAVLAVRARPCVSETEGKTVRGVVEMMCLYVPAGREQAACVRGEAPFEMQLDEEIPANSSILAEACDADAVSLVSDRMEVRCQLTVRCSCPVQTRIPAIYNIAETEAQKPSAGLYIRYASGRETLWDIARRYRAAPEDLKRGGAENELPAAGEPVLVWI